MKTLLICIAGTAVAALAVMIVAIIRAPKDYELTHVYDLLMREATPEVRAIIFRQYPQIVESFLAGDSPRQFNDKYPQIIGELFYGWTEMPEAKRRKEQASKGRK